MNYRIVYKDELYHYGVKGMKWGVRKQPETSGGARSRKGMSTAKKVAIGIAVVAAVGGSTYIGIKTGGAKQIVNGAARIARSKTRLLSESKFGKKSVSTADVNRALISKTPTQAIDSNRNVAKKLYAHRHGTSVSSSNIKKARKIQGYSNKNYTELGRAKYKSDFAKKSYDKNMTKFTNWTQNGKKFANDPKTAKHYEAGKKILASQVLNSRNRADVAQYNLSQAFINANTTKSFTRTRPIKYRRLN